MSRLKTWSKFLKLPTVFRRLIWRNMRWISSSITFQRYSARVVLINLHCISTLSIHLFTGSKNAKNTQFESRAFTRRAREFSWRYEWFETSRFIMPQCKQWERLMSKMPVKNWYSELPTFMIRLKFHHNLSLPVCFHQITLIYPRLTTLLFGFSSLFL